MRRAIGMGAVAVAVTLALVATGCGSSSDSQSSSSGDASGGVEPLLDRVPSEAYLVKAMDMATAKRQLGVAADLDPKLYSGRQAGGTPEERFDEAALQVLDYLVSKSPFKGVLDNGQVQAGVRATMIPGGELIIVRTPQAPSEIERGLEKAGLQPSGEDAFALPKREGVYGLAAAALGDGVVVFAETTDIATGVLRRKEPEPGQAPARELLERTRGALRTVHTYKADSTNAESACLLGVAGGQLFEPGNADEDLVLRVKGVPRASAVTLGEGVQRRDILTKSYSVTDVSRSGQVLALKVRTAGDAISRANAATIADGSVRPHLIYRCPGAAAERARREIESRKPLFSPRPEPDRSGSRLETVISNYIAALSTAPNALRVRCKTQTLAPGTRKLPCTATRRHKGRLYHYTMTVTFRPNRSIEYLDIDSPDDQTGTIVTKPKKGEKERRPTE